MSWGVMRLSWLERIWSKVGERKRELLRLAAPNISPLDRTCRLAEALVSERGEASGAALAGALQISYQSLDSAAREAFLNFVATQFGPDENSLISAARAYLEAPSPQQATELFSVADPPRQELLRRMNMAPNGTALLIGIREEVLRHVAERPGLKPLETDLHHLFASWFNKGFLELRRIDWNTPAAILEKLIAHEAVHEIQGWDDLRRRLKNDRRCFGFFHPTLPDEPLIFVEVALVRGLSGAIQPLLDQKDTKAALNEPDTAIFYSISNCQQGLRGISFGNFLIKKVVQKLKTELPSLKCFATLSPVPGFAKWLLSRLHSPAAEVEKLFYPKEAQALLGAVTATSEPAIALDSILQKQTWWHEPSLVALLRPILMRLCAVYLTEGRNGKGPKDQVARFHLGNGARLERINWLGNTAPRGMKESFGLMVNYFYDLDYIEINHETFVHQGFVACSGEVEELLKPPEAIAATAAAATQRLAGIVPLRRNQKRNHKEAAG